MARTFANAMPGLHWQLCGRRRRIDDGRPSRAMGSVRRWILAGTFLLGISTGVTPVFAQVSKEYQLKAVFLWRLAQFTDWPADAFESAASPIFICVLGESPFGDAVEAAVRGETAHGRSLIVRHYRTVDQARSCHILFISAVGPRQGTEIGAALAGRSILTVRDLDALPNAYPAIVSFVTEQNRIRLRINLKAATAARLVLDPRLLRAAEIVAE